MFRDPDNVMISTQCQPCDTSEVCEIHVFGPDETFRFWFEDATDTIRCRDRNLIEPHESMSVSNILRLPDKDRDRD